MTLYWGDNFENLTLIGSVNGTGNSLENYIRGSSETNIIHGGGGDDGIWGQGGLDSLFGGSGNDLITGAHSNELLDGGDGNDYLRGESGDDTLIGGLGNDFLDGGDGDDILIGSTANTGSREVDVFLGGLGKDTFILGDQNSNFYFKENSIARTSRYAVIKDMSSSDTIQLKGLSTNYILGASPFHRNNEVALYFDNNTNQIADAEDNLVALIRNHTLLSTDDAVFLYV